MPTFLLTAIVLVPTGLSMLTLTTACNSSVQLGVDPTMRGRVMALYLICFMGGTPLGAPIVGWLAGVRRPALGADRRRPGLPASRRRALAGAVARRRGMIAGGRRRTGCTPCLRCSHR